MPLPDFHETVQCLDKRRLNKQRLEAIQILETLNKPQDEKGKGWSNHPAVLMWNGYTEALIDYGLACVEQAAIKGFRPGDLGNRLIRFSFGDEIVMPHWMGNEAFHASHRAALLRKGLEDTTFNIFKQNPPKYSERFQFPLLKRDWKPIHYTEFWKRFFKPEKTHYTQFGWTEEPAEPNEKGSLPYVWPKMKETNQ